ncbi:MAG: twin-arginine translocation signal domain-containing protein, partial [Desulfobacterales bacterium]|nr:twin-arginine translocation signal domain-containing protein [Desulfobacterales bacterium]
MSRKEDRGVSRRGFIKKSTLGVAASALIPGFMKGGLAFASEAKSKGRQMKMFCYQCEQTFKGKGCTSRGICGKSPEVSALQDLLIHTLKGVSVAAHAAGLKGVRDNEADRFVCEALFSTLTNVDFDPSRFEDLLEESIALRDRMIKKAAAAGATVDMSFDAMGLKLKRSSEGLVAQGRAHGLLSDTSMGEDLLSLQHLLLFGLKGLAAYTDHAAELGQEDAVVYEYVHRALVGLTVKPEMNTLLGLVLECGEKNLRAMELLDAG